MKTIKWSHSILFIIINCYLVSVASASKICTLEGKWAGFTMHSRASDSPKQMVLKLADMTYPRSEYPAMNRRSKEITEEIYQWSSSKLNRYKPFKKNQLIKVEDDFEVACRNR